MFEEFLSGATPSQDKSDSMYAHVMQRYVNVNQYSNGLYFEKTASGIVVGSGPVSLRGTNKSSSKTRTNLPT